MALAAAEHSGTFIAVDDGFVYWSADDMVRRAPRAGGPVETVASGISFAMGLDVDEHYVYFATHNDDFVYRVSKGGGLPEPIAAVPVGGGAWAMVRVDDSHVFFRGLCPELWRLSKADAELELIALDEDHCIGGLAMDADALYYFDETGAVKKVPKAGGAPAVLVDQSAAAHGGAGTSPSIAVDAHSVYWMSHSNGTMAKASKHGGPVTVLVTGIENGQDVFVDDDAVYWSEHLKVGKVAKDGSNATTVAQWNGAHDLLAQIQPMGLVTAGQRLFFTSYVTTAPVVSICK